MLVYVTVVLVVMARQFSFLTVLDPDPEQDKVVVLQKVASELHPKVCNHGEGPY